MLTPLLLAALAAPPALAEEPGPEELNELFLGESALPQDAWEFQLTAMPGWSPGGAGLPMFIELGFTDWLQLEVGAPLAPGGRPALGAPEVALGFRLLALEEVGLTVSAGPEVGLPAPGGEGELGGGLGLAVHQRLPGPWRLNASGGLERALASGEAEVGDTAEEALEAQAAVGAYALLGPLVPMAEVAWSAEGEAGALATSVGLAWHPGAGLELGLAGVRTQEAGGPASLGGVLNLTWEMGLGGEGEQAPGQRWDRADSRSEGHDAAAMVARHRPRPGARMW